MPLPTSGPIDLAQIQTEFGGVNPIGLDEYYQGAATGFVTSSNYTPAGQIPTSGPISLANFYGVTKNALAVIPANNSWTVFTNGLAPIARLNFSSSGTTNSVGTNDPSAVTTPNWINPTTANIGNSYWVRFGIQNYTDSQNDPYQASTSSIVAPYIWQQLTTATTPFVELNPNALQSVFVEISVEFSTDAFGSNIVATGAIILSTVRTAVVQTSFTFNDVVAANRTAYNLRDRAQAAGWNGTSQLIATVTVNPGVYIVGTTSVPAFSLGATLPVGSTVTLTNNGIIAGAGGNGGQGGSVSNGSLTNGAPGAAGGIAMSLNYAISVYNNGTIGGGGGGGGGGASGTLVETDKNFVTTYNVSNGAGGGGGRAIDTFTFSGGYAGANGSIAGDIQWGVTAPPQNATLVGSGAGGTGGGVGQYGPDGGRGGIGGGFGGNGASGSVCLGEASSVSSPGAGGAAGAAIVGGAFITWYAHATRQGSFDSLGTNTVPTLGDAGQAPIPDPGGGGGGGSVSIYAFMPFLAKLAGEFVPGDELMLMNEARDSYMPGTVISNRVSMQKLVRFTSSSGITLTCSDNTPLTLRDGTCINSTEALGVELPVYDENGGFRWEEIVVLEHLEERGQVATIYCADQCYAAGDEPGRFIFTHNATNSKF